MTAPLLLLAILLPSVSSFLALIFYRKSAAWLGEAILLIVTLANLGIVFTLYGQELSFVAPWGAYGLQFSLRLYHFSSFILAAAAVFAVLIALYSVKFMRGRAQNNQFYFFFLLTLGFLNGAVLADNFILLLFFWEGLLITLYGMIYPGNPKGFATANKAFIIAGATDLCLMLGVGLTVFLAGTATISDISLAMTGDNGGLVATAFVLLMIGAISKAGSMPFHSWIPDAAVDAPLPFMALVPAALEKLLGIYLLARISLDVFQLNPDSWLSTLLMVIGLITILLAVFMALIQKDFKRLLSFHAISQVGYMILGIGTFHPVGIVGGLFHMINHAMYKSCLFLTGGAVEMQTGTTDLRKLGGIGRMMPITFVCFIIAAASISGVPPFNGFFSKELVFAGALERGLIFYLAALLGSILTAASFLKLGHAAFIKRSENDDLKEQIAIGDVKEVHWTMWAPMALIAGLCILFGVYSELPVTTLILPINPELFAGDYHYYGFPADMFLVGMSLLAMALALLNHWYGFKRSGSGLKASDHIHYAPGFKQVYDKAESGVLDPYNIAMKLMDIVAAIAWGIDRAIDFFYDRIVVGTTMSCVQLIRRVHTGTHVMYLVWSIVGFIVFVTYFMGGI